MVKLTEIYLAVTGGMEANARKPYLDEVQTYCEALLKRDDFNELCPRKPDGAKLRKVLDTTPDAAELKRCARVSHTQRLELRAPAETKVTEKAA